MRFTPQRLVEERRVRREIVGGALRGEPCHQGRGRGAGRLAVDRRPLAPEERDAGAEIPAVIVPGRGLRFGDRDLARRALDGGTEARDRLEVGMRLQPAVPGQRLQCASEPSGFASTGIHRTPRPKRKTVAAINPIEMPHSKIDGM